MLLGAVAFAAVGCNKGAADTINVFSREDGSGTRSAFTELTGVLVENELHQRHHDRRSAG